MADEELCKKLRKLLSGLLRKGFKKDLDACLGARGCELWILGLDLTKSEFVDVCGNIPADAFEAIRARGFSDSIAGYRAEAHKTFGFDGYKADIFLLNTRYFSAQAKHLEPLIVHELAHLLEQLDEQPIPVGNDEANAEAILQSLKSDLLHLHPRIWALHLAGAGRLLVEKEQTQHTTIRAFLETAVPRCDRTGDIRARKGFGDPPACCREPNSTSTCSREE